MGPPLNNPNMGPPLNRNPNNPNNFQPMPVGNQGGQPIPISNQNPPNMNNQNPQAGQGGRMPIPVTNQQGGVPNVMPANQNPQMAQFPPGAQSEFTCAQAGRSAVAQCFQQNGGFEMSVVIALLSNGTQGQLPPNSEMYKQTLCG